MPKTFLDSNVWFSAFYGSENCKKLIDAGKRGKISPVVSEQVLEETIRNIREKKPDQLENFQSFISENPPEMYPDPTNLDPKIRKLVSQEDAPIFCSAIKAKVDYFVTGNIKDFNVRKLNKLTGIQVLTPKEAVKVLDL